MRIKIEWDDIVQGECCELSHDGGNDEFNLNLFFQKTNMATLDIYGDMAFSKADVIQLIEILQRFVDTGTMMLEKSDEH